MKFKIGETVRLKHVTEDDERLTALIYWTAFKKYEGLTATIEKAYNHKRENMYFILIDSTPNKKRFNYAESWLETLITYEAF